MFLKSIGVLGVVFFGLILLSSSEGVEQAARPLTFCNPMDLACRFVLKNNSLAKGVSAREAADPTMVLFKREYWIFASKSDGSAGGLGVKMARPINKNNPAMGC